MKYIKELKEKDFAKALSLNANQEFRLKKIISDSYDQNWHREGPNIDQIIAFVAPHIFTPEEAFYASSVIFSDVVGSIDQLEWLNKKQN